MLYLYDKDAREFSRNGIPLHDAYDAHVIREEGFYLKFKMLLNEQYKRLKKEMIVSAMTPSGYNQFRIFDINPHSDHIEVVALHLFYYLDNRLVRPFELKRVNGKGAIQSFVSSFVSNIEPYTFDSSVTEVHDFQSATTESENDRYQNALEVINRIATRWDSEFELNGFDVRMIKRLGRRTNALLYEKKNIAEFEEESTIRNLVTRIHAVSKWTIGHDEPGYVKDGNNEREIKVIVDSPLVDHYSQVYEVQYINNDCRTEKELVDWAKLKYSTHHLDKPKRNIKVKTNIIDGTEINLGDELVLKYLVHDIDEVIRCVGYDYDPLGKTYYEVTLGDWRQSFGDTVHRATADISDRQISQIETLKKHVQIVQMKADGIGRVTYGPNPVPNPRNGDIWYFYSLDRPDEIILKVWDGELGDWKEIPLDNSELIKKVEDLETKAQEMSSRIAEADEKVKEALESVKVNKYLAEEANRLSEMTHRAFSDAQVELGAHYKRFKTLNDTTDKLKTDISGIQTDLDGLSSTVNKTMLDPKTGLLTRLQNEQKQTSDALKSKLSSAEVNRLIDGKNLLSIRDYTNDKNETARGIEQKLSELSSKIPVEIGGRNYVRGSADMALGSGRWDTGTFRQSGAGLTATVSIEDFPNQDIKKAVRINRNDTGSPGITQDHFALSSGDWTLSWWVKAPIGTQFRVQAYWSDANNRTGVSQTMTSQTNDWQRVHFTTTNTVEGNSSIAYVYLVNGSEMLVTAPKLEKGRILTDWSPAPEDNQIDQEVFSNLRRTASLTEQIFGSRDKSGALTNLSREIATSEIFQREVIKLNDRNHNLVVDGKGMEVVKEINIRNGVTKYEDTIQPNGFRTIGIEAAGQTAYRWAGISLPLSVDEVKQGEVYTFYAEYDIEALPDFDFVAQLKNQSTGEIAGSVNLDRGAIRRYNQSFKIHVHRNVQNPELYLYLVKNGKVRISQPVLLKGSYDDVDSYVSSGVGSVISARMSQIAGSFAFNILKGSDDILAQLNLNSGGVKIDGKLVQITGETFIDKGVIKSAHIQSLDASKITTGSLDASNARIINLDIKDLVGDKSQFLQSVWQSTNSYSYIDGTKIQVRGNDGSYVEMNNIPEFRSSDPTGTSTVMGMGRTHYLDKDGVSLGYIGMNLYSFDYNGARVPSGSKYGVWLSRGSGGFSINYMQDGGYVAGSENVYYTVPSNGLGPVNVIENVMRWKKNQGNWAKYEWVKSELARLNGYGAWPWSTTFRQGDRVIVEKGSTATYVPAGYKRYLDCTTSKDGTHTIYTYTEVRMEKPVIVKENLWVRKEARVGSLRNDSDRKLKENIKEVTSSALNDLMALKVVSFDWKETGQHQRYGLIAQDSGKFRVKGETEGVNLTELIYASVKAIQELNERMDRYEARGNG